MKTNIQEEIIHEASKLLSDIYFEYQGRGMLAVYLWGSITRDDFNPTVSDVDALVVIDRSIDLDLRQTLKNILKQRFSRDMKFGLQFYGIEELNGGEPYTLLAEVQPPEYLLLRFHDWIHVAGNIYQRSDFSVLDMTPREAMQHQLRQVKHALEVLHGTRPIDPRRSGPESMSEDVVKGVLGALYWESVMRGNREPLHYRKLQGLVRGEFQQITEDLLAIRESDSYSQQAILELQTGIHKLMTGLVDR